MEAHEASDTALSSSLQDLIKRETDIKADVVDRQAQIDQLEEKVRQANMDTFGAAADKLPPSSLGGCLVYQHDNKVVCTLFCTLS